MPINSQVFDAGMRRPTSRRMRSPPITRNAAASTVRMYFARPKSHHAGEQSRLPGRRSPPLKERRARFQ